MSTANTVTGIVGQGAIGLLAASQLALHQCPFHLAELSFHSMASSLKKFYCSV